MKNIDYLLMKEDFFEALKGEFSYSGLERYFQGSFGGAYERKHTS